MVKYYHEVLGKDVAVQFRVGKKKANKTYKGTILRVQISMEDEDERLEQGAAYFEDGRELKLQVLHEVVFSDGEEHWLDLAETESLGRLTWCDNNNAKNDSNEKATTTPSLQREVSMANSASSSSSDEDSDTAAVKMPEGKKREGESSTTTQPTVTTEKAERRDSGIRVSLKKAKKMRRIMLAQLVAAQAAETGTSNDTGEAQVVTPGADQSALKKKKRPREEATELSSSTSEQRSAKKKKAARKSPARKSPTARKAQKVPPLQARNGTGPKWVEQMFDWMVTVGGSTPKTALRIRKEVLKLANGEGVTHQQWAEAGVKPFYEGIAVSILTTDMEQLQQDSMDHQSKHGKDPSHGWLLNGPISKLKAFQEYLLTL